MPENGLKRIDFSCKNNAFYFKLIKDFIKIPWKQRWNILKVNFI